MTPRSMRIVGLMAGIAVLGAAAAPARATGPHASLDWSQPWLQPRDAHAAVAISDEYAWRLFVAVNWPAAERAGRTGHAGRADVKAALGAADRPTVWETWANTAEIFRSDGADPGAWDHASGPPDGAAPTRFETESLKDLPNLRHIVAGRMVPLADPVANARRLTEIRMNRAAFDYIRAHDLYNLDGQLKLLAERRAVNFPIGTTEVKAMWRPITSAEKSRYHTVEIRQPDGTSRLYGLTAMHLVTKDLPNWFWATFEQVDNPTLPDNDGWLLPSRDRFACAASRPDCNRVPSGIGLEAGVWQYYRLRGTLVRYVDAAGRPLRLANSELEAGLQASASCMSCHARASIGVAAGAPVRLPVFDSNASAAGQGSRVGFLGPPQKDWFARTGGDDRTAPVFQPLDFVWSLSKARPKRGST